MFANEGNDTTVVGRGNDTVFGGLGDDSLIGIHNVDLPLYFGNEGADTIAITGALVVTIIGGNDSADGNDSLTSARGVGFHLRQRRCRHDQRGRRRQHRGRAASASTAF